MGRILETDTFYVVRDKKLPRHDYLTWKGELTKLQAAVAEKPCQIDLQDKPYLVHAVTGGGKTEMIYPVIAKFLKAGRRVAIASPRVDVCRELHQRLDRDFSCRIDLLYAGSMPYSNAPLMIASCHQLLKFHQAFDLLIIDEVDAFLFVDDAILYYAASRSRKEDSSLIYLTATSTGQVVRMSLLRRFHNQPLVVPDYRWMPSLKAPKKRKKSFIFYQNGLENRPKQDSIACICA